MIDVELARKFILQYIPPEGAIQMNDILNCIKQDPILILRNGLMFTNLEYIKSDEPRVSPAAAAGLTTGFALAYCMQFPEFVENLKSAVELGKRNEGENVVSFLERKKTL